MNIHPVQILADNESLLMNSGDAFQLAAGRNYPSSASSTPGVAVVDCHKYKHLGLDTQKKDITHACYRNNNITDTENFLLEPNAVFEKETSKIKVMKKTPAIRSPPDTSGKLLQNNVPSGTRIDSQKEVDTETKSNAYLFRSPQEVIDFLTQRQAIMSNRKMNTMEVLKQTNLELARPTMNEVNLQINSNYFLDGKELERNVVIDLVTNRSYVYTTDLEAKWKLPEFLFLDVPNSTYIARACGQFITNKLVAELKQRVKPGSKQPFAILESLVKNCNKSQYEVRNIYVPHQPQYHGYLRTNIDSMSIDVPVQAITSKFRLRYAKNGTQIHKMLYHNFMNGHRCTRGILVFIPSMEKGSPSDQFWGSSEGVERLPEVDGCINNYKMDRWCAHIAKLHGTYRGKDPELMGLAVKDRKSVGPFSRHKDNTSRRVADNKFAVKPRKSSKATTKDSKRTKRAPTKKKTCRKKVIESVCKTKTVPHKIPSLKEIEKKIKAEGGEEME